MNLTQYPNSVLPTDWFIAGLNSIPLPTYDHVKSYFDEMIVNGKWGKAGPSRWIVVRGFDKKWLAPEELQIMRLHTPNDGFSMTTTRRLLTVRQEWSKK